MSSLDAATLFTGRAVIAVAIALLFSAASSVGEQLAAAAAACARRLFPTRRAASCRLAGALLLMRWPPQPRVSADKPLDLAPGDLAPVSSAVRARAGPAPSSAWPRTEALTTRCSRCLQVMLQCAVSLVLGAFGVVMVAGKLQVRAPPAPSRPPRSACPRLTPGPRSCCSRSACQRSWTAPARASRISTRTSWCSTTEAG